MTRVLFLGENWYGSCARACCYALRRLGCDVTDIDIQTFIPQWRSPLLRGFRRLLAGQARDEFNQAILEASRSQPDFLLAFKGALVEPETLRTLRERGVALYNYFPDTSAFAHGSLLAESLPLYNCVFYTKTFWDRDVRSRIPLRKSIFLPHGYDPEVHARPALDARDLAEHAHDVVLVATHTPAKERWIRELLAAAPGLDLVIWGNLWNPSGALRRHVRGRAINGMAYAKALSGARICLAIMSGQVTGSSQGDETTTRTFEIPACGGFLLHERTAEVLTLFDEGMEMACFGSVDELVEKIHYYLAHSAGRDVIAEGGHRRCVPAYSYDNRMSAILKYHADAV